MYNGYFHELDSPDKVYWFGFLVGDGSIGVYDRSYRMSITIKGEDHAHIETISNVIGYDSNRVKSRPDGCYDLQIVSKELFNDLNKHGITPRKAHTVTDDIIPPSYQWDFIRGLIDSDGSIHFNQKELNCILSIYGNYPLLNGVKSIINSNGSLIENKSRSGRADVLSYGGRWHVQHILDNIYYDGCICLPRKFKVYNNIVEFNLNHPKGGHIHKKYTIYKNGRSYIELTCGICGKKFLARSDHAAESTNHFCSRICGLKHARRVRSEKCR